MFTSFRSPCEFTSFPCLETTHFEHTTSDEISPKRSYTSLSIPISSIINLPFSSIIVPKHSHTSKYRPRGPPMKYSLESEQYCSKQQSEPYHSRVSSASNSSEIHRNSERIFHSLHNAHRRSYDNSQVSNEDPADISTRYPSQDVLDVRPIPVSMSTNISIVADSVDQSSKDKPPIKGRRSRGMSLSEVKREPWGMSSTEEFQVGDGGSYWRSGLISTDWSSKVNVTYLAHIVIILLCAV